MIKEATLSLYVYIKGIDVMEPVTLMRLLYESEKGQDCHSRKTTKVAAWHPISRNHTLIL